MTESLKQMVNTAGSQTEDLGGASRSASLSETDGNTAQTFVLSTAKNGHITQCIAVADLINVEVKDILQVPGMNKALPGWQMELDKFRWFLPSLRAVWRFRKGKFLILASGRSVLLACRLLKILRGDKVFVLFIGSPRNWTAKCVDVMLRPQHEREADQIEDGQYPWKPKQVWIDSLICRPLPVSGAKETGVAVLLGGLNITYGDELLDYSDFLDKLNDLAGRHPVSIVCSRRTKACVKEAIEKRFKHTSAKLVDANDRQGFLNACERAGAFVVTPDSITMVAEACATGKPVYTAKLPVKRTDTRNHRFMETHLNNGYVQEFDGTISFDRRPVDRTDVEAARRDITAFIEAWRRNPSSLSS